ncbi:hypothetical protein BG004_001527 [Podila humilis]|nr:hypothetical protein BG004_001527 [Podila humilis]
MWRVVDLPKTQIDRWGALRSNGHLVEILNQIHGDRRSLQFTGKYLTSVVYLVLQFDSRAWISYSVLEKFFSRMVNVTHLRLIVDGSLFSPAMFWSLSQLKNLDTLTFFVSYSKWFVTKHYEAKDYLDILDCCSHVHDLTLMGAFLEPELGVHQIKTTIRQHATKLFLSCPEFTPSTPLEAIARSRLLPQPMAAVAPINPQTIAHYKAQMESILDEKRELSFVFPLNPTRHTLSSTGITYSLRRLYFKTVMLEENDFVSLVSRCPLLENLYLRNCTLNITAPNWRIFAERCPNLRILRIRENETVRFMPIVEKVLIMFPKIEVLHLEDLVFPTDPDFEWATLPDPATGEPRKLPPLEHIHLTGAVIEPLKTLYDCLTSFPRLEYLATGLTMNTVRQVDPYVVQFKKYDFDQKPWLSIKTLACLDVVSCIFDNDHNFTTFFSQVRKLRRLATLRLSIWHIRTALSLSGYETAVVYPPPGMEDEVFFYFPVMKELFIGSSISRHGRLATPATFDDMDFTIRSSPSLRSFDLMHFVEPGVVTMVREQYPYIRFTQGPCARK